MLNKTRHYDIFTFHSEKLQQAVTMAIPRLSESKQASVNMLQKLIPLVWAGAHHLERTTAKCEEPLLRVSKDQTIFR